MVCIALHFRGPPPFSDDVHLLSCSCRDAPEGDGKFNHDYRNLNYCTTPGGFHLALFFLCGLSYSGPYWQVWTTGGRTLPLHPSHTHPSSAV